MFLRKWMSILILTQKLQIKILQTKVELIHKLKNKNLKKLTLIQIRWTKIFHQLKNYQMKKMMKLKINSK